MTIWMMAQFGSAMMPDPVYSAMAWGFTWALTSGTFGSIRQALEVSMHTAPAQGGKGQYSRERSPPAAKKAMSIPVKESCQLPPLQPVPP